MSTAIDMNARTTRWRKRLDAARVRISGSSGMNTTGRLTRVAGITLEAVGCHVPMGGRCRIENAHGVDLEAEVVGFGDSKLFLMPVGGLQGIVANARVQPIRTASSVRVGDALLGRVIDASGEPLDGKGPICCEDSVPLAGVERNPLQRSPIAEPLDVGIRSINALLSVGRGQRIGLFANSGVGKSVLLGMMTRFTNADVVVVGLIGERGREVQEFIQNNLGAAGLARAVVVAAPADRPPLQRLHGAALATAIAEYFCAKGKRVLLLMDSLTRYAQAQREIGLAIGEPPVTKGFPPSVFARIPHLVERAGTAEHGGGSITGIYTVLTEGDPETDPIADSARAILDGHVVLSRQLAESGCFPAIDIEASISRVMLQVVQESQALRARRFKQLYSVYEKNRDLIAVGAYVAGTNRDLDIAVQHFPALLNFLRQDTQEQVTLADSIEQLKFLCESLAEPNTSDGPR